MFAQVERGAGMDQVHLLRCLVEVGSRLGRCADAMAYAARAARTAEEFDLEPHTGWFITGVAELAGGDLGPGPHRSPSAASPPRRRPATPATSSGTCWCSARRCSAPARPRPRAPRSSGSATIEATAGDRRPDRQPLAPRAGLRAWSRSATWPRPTIVLDAARRAVDGRLGTDGVSAQLDRAEAELLGARGDVEDALMLLDRSEKVCRDLGMRVDVGRTLLDPRPPRTPPPPGRRGPRRAGDGRGAVRRAPRHRLAWSRSAPSSPGAAAAAPSGLDDLLTETEARVAAEVARGASNREIAERLYVSVKTVEATLTRIYRKLEVRSRTQLAARLTRRHAAARPRGRLVASAALRTSPGFDALARLVLSRVACSTWLRHAPLVPRAPLPAQGFSRYPCPAGSS